MHWGGRAGQVVDLVHLQQQLLHHIVPDQLKVVLADEVRDVLLAACEEVVHADDLQLETLFTQLMMSLFLRLVTGILKSSPSDSRKQLAATRHGSTQGVCQGLRWSSAAVNKHARMAGR